MFPYEMVQVIEQTNQQYQMADQIVPVVSINNNDKEEVVGYKLVGVRMTTRQKVIKIEQDVYSKDGNVIPITTGRW